MWPFNNRPYKQRMCRVKLADGQEFVGKPGDDFFIGTTFFRRADPDGEIVLYPLACVREIRYWTILFWGGKE